MDDNVMRKYATPPSESRHYVQYDQGTICRRGAVPGNILWGPREMTPCSKSELDPWKKIFVNVHTRFAACP